jgi:hemoglobin/transferrin/lactoferrin receptor protein
VNPRSKAYFLFLALALPICSVAQEISIRDQRTNEPLPWVTITGNTPDAFAITKEDGSVNLSIFNGAEKLLLRSVSHQTRTIMQIDTLKTGDILYLKSALISLENVVVSATRWRQTSSNVASKITTISAKEIGLIQPQTAADLLSASGSVFVQKSQQGGGSPMIRGFATNRLIYTVDGVRMNNAIFRGGNIQNVINLDPFATESAEILFGPGSVIYGSDAIGGVMSFQTLKLRLSRSEVLEVSGKVNTRYSSANQEKTGHVDVMLSKEKWASITSLSRWDYNHLRQGSNGPDDYLKTVYVESRGAMDVVIQQEDELLQIPSAYAQSNFMQKIRYAPSKQWNLEYGYHYSKTSPYGRYDRQSRVRNGLPRYGEWDYGPQSWQMHLLKIDNKGPTVIYDQLTTRMAFQRFGESRITRNLNSPERTTRVENVDAYSVNIDLVKKITKKGQLYYGAEWVTNLVKSTGSSIDLNTEQTLFAQPRYPDANWHSGAIYANTELYIRPKLTLTSGLRVNQFSVKTAFDPSEFQIPLEDIRNTDIALTGAIGMVYRASDSWTISSSAGTAFRSPNVDDIGKIFDSEPGSVTVPNSTLSAEYAYNVDLSTAKILFEKIKLEATGYYTLLDHAMVRRNARFNGQDSILYDGTLSQVQSIQNAAQARVFGAQMSIELFLTDYLRIRSDYNAQIGEEELDDGTVSPARHAAPAFGQSSVRFNKKSITIQLYAVYQGRKTASDLPFEERQKDEIYAKDRSGRNYVPSWYTINLKAGYIINKALQLNLGLENITDQRYRPFASGISGAGRNAILALQWSF